MERTLIIVKPDAVGQSYTGDILASFEKEGLRILGLKKIQLSKQAAQGFYHVHRERPFFDSLTDFMSSGPIVPVVLEGENAIKRVRELMGATNPAEAADGTLRKRFATDVEKNAVHGSDSPESASTEIPYFFSACDLVG